MFKYIKENTKDEEITEEEFLTAHKVNKDKLELFKKAVVARDAMLDKRNQTIPYKIKSKYDEIDHEDYVCIFRDIDYPKYSDKGKYGYIFEMTYKGLNTATEFKFDNLMKIANTSVFILG